MGPNPSLEAWSIVRRPTPCALSTLTQRRQAPSCALALALLLAAPCRAQGPAAPLLPGWPGIETRLNVTAEMLDTRWSSLVRTPSSAPDYSLASQSPATTWSPFRHAPDLIDLTPPVPAAGQSQVYVRPQFALGVSSESLRGLLRFAGVDATACTAPLMRMHSSFAGSTSHAKVSLSARCSID